MLPLRSPGTTRIAANSGWLRQYASDFSGPKTNKAVEAASANAALGASTVADKTPSAGHPVRG